MTEVRRFRGLNGRTDRPTVSKPVADEYTDVETTFNELFHSLPRAIPATVGWQNPLTGKYHDTDRFQALVDPDKVELYMATENDEHDPLFNVPTHDYSVVNPSEFYGPLEDVLMENDMVDVFGKATLDRNGARCYMDIMFAGTETQIPEEAEGSILFGIHTGYDHLGTTACFATGYAQDTRCRNSIRDITDRMTRRHVGDAIEDVQWWEDVLTQFGTLPDHLGEAIEAAMDIELSITDLPFEQWSEFYQFAGFSGPMAQSASMHARERGEDPWHLNAWNLHSGATYALTHDFRGKVGSDTYSRYMQIANDLLMNPQMVIQQVQENYERSLRERDASDELEEAQAQFTELETTIEDRKDEYNTRQEQMESLFQEIEAE